MTLNRSSNIAMKGFNHVSLNEHSTNHMQVSSTLNKTLILLLITTLVGTISWTYISPALVLPLVIVSLIVGLITIFTLMFKPLLAKYLAPAYAIVQGAFLGLISRFFELMYPGIVTQAILLTIAVALIMNYLYQNRIIKVTEKFKSVIMVATGAIFVVYIISFVMSFFGNSIPMIHSSGIVGIGFSLVVVTIASLNLLLDFSFIEEQANKKVIKDMEWYGAFMLLVTILWIYIEILRLLGKLANRD